MGHGGTNLMMLEVKSTLYPPGILDPSAMTVSMRLVVAFWYSSDKWVLGI